MKYYKCFPDIFDNIYSLDMVRLNFIVRSCYAEEFKHLVDLVSFDVHCNTQYFRNYKSLGYRNFWQVTIQYDNEIGSFVFGTKLNNKKENENCGFLEFNPNKLMQFSVFQKFLNDLDLICSSIELVRYDCAIDVPVSRDKIRMIRTNKCNYEYKYVTESKGVIISHSLTEYQGKRNSNKFTKLYDKTAESNLDYDLSRIEFTFDKNEVDFLNLPQFYVYSDLFNKGLDFTVLSDSQLVLVDLLRNSEDKNFYLRRLSYRIREKLKPFLCDLDLPIYKEILLNVRDLALNFEK